MVDFDEVTDDLNLFTTGYIDSFGFVELVQFLEREYKITVPNEDLINNSLVSLNSIVSYIESHNTYI